MIDKALYTVCCLMVFLAGFVAGINMIHPEHHVPIPFMAILAFIPAFILAAVFAYIGYDQLKK